MHKNRHYVKKKEISPTTYVNLWVGITLLGHVILDFILLLWIYTILFFFFLPCNEFLYSIAYRIWYWGYDDLETVLKIQIKILVYTLILRELLVTLSNETEACVLKYWNFYKQKKNENHFIFQNCRNYAEKGGDSKIGIKCTKSEGVS